MTSIVLLGKIEGSSALVTDGQYCGDVRHSLRIYQCSLGDVIVAGGKLWGDDLVLQRATTGENVTLRLGDGETIRIVAQRRSADKTYVFVEVDGAISGF